MFTDVLHYISGPVIGAIIGAFTNYIAIKMLFRPLKPVKIGRFRVPLTPGVIPRHQKKLASALSDTVYQNFFTTNDIENIFMTDEMASRFSRGLLDRLSGLKLSDLGKHVSEESRYKAMEAVYRKIHEILLTTDIAGIVAEETRKMIQQKAQGGFISGLLLKDDLAARISGYAGNQVAEYVRKHDMDLLLPIFLKEGEELAQLCPVEAAEQAGIEEEQMLNLLKAGYYDFMAHAKSVIAEGFHMKQFIYDRIMELDPADIERLVNGAIKREMNYLVYLGGFLGLLIGIVNIFI